MKFSNAKRPSLKVFVAMLALALALPGGCDSAPPVVGSGVVRKESRQIAGVDAVEFTNQGDLDIQQGAVESVSVEADDNLLPLIQTTLRDHTLVIATQSGVGEIQYKSMRYHLTVKNLKSISILGSGTTTVPAFHASDLKLSIAGSGSISIDQLQSNSADLEVSGSGHMVIKGLDAKDLAGSISGSGRIDLAGRTANQTVDISGSGLYTANRLTCGECKVDIAGSGSVSVACSDALTAAISGSGNVRYAGSPKLSTSVSGSGSIEKLPP